MEWLSRHPSVVSASRIAGAFSMDPIAVLRDRGDPLVELVREAAYQVWVRDEEARAKAAKA